MPNPEADETGHAPWRRRQVLGALGLGSTLAACGGGGSEAPAPAPAPAPPAVNNVIFIGNSFTRFHGGLDTHVRALAASMRVPRSLTVQRITQDGARLVELRQDAAVMQAVRAGGYDVVVLQDDLPEYGGPSVEPFKLEVRAFNTEIRAKAGRTLLFMAWAYERLNWINQATIASAHRAIATELALPVAPVGLAMDASRAERPALAMLGDDREHESLAGMYLAACVVFGALFLESPEGASYLPSGVTADDAALLQRVAWRSVSDWNAGR